MNSSSNSSRIDIRKRYQAACAQCVAGSAPPDIDSFLVDCPEPERSGLRTELESLRASFSKRRPGIAATERPNQNHATLDDPSRKHPEKKGTTDSPGHGDATVDRAPQKPGGTLDFAPRSDEPKKSKHNLSKGPTAVPGYEILGVLGRGAMGVVYKVRQTGLNRIAALKMILSGGHASEKQG